MNRRQFLRASSVALATHAALADTAIPTAPLGKTGMRITRITLGGAHMRFGTEANALAIIRRALDLGINMFDSAHKYNNGESDACYGKVITGPSAQERLPHVQGAPAHARRGHAATGRDAAARCGPITWTSGSATK